MSKKKRLPKQDLADGVVFVRAGLCQAVACAPKAMKRADAIRQAKINLGPSGTTHDWQPSRKRKLGDGTKLPAPCLDAPGRVHYLLEC